MKASIFEYVVVYSPVDKDGNETEPAKIIAEDRILAKSQDKAVLVIARSIPDEYIEKSDFIDIVIRPF